jgi:hypothetical protein
MSTATAASNSTTNQRPNYGIDSPGMAVGEAVIGAVALADREA